MSLLNSNTFIRVVVKVQKNLPKEEEREGGEKSTLSAPAGARTRTLGKSPQLHATGVV